MDGGNLAPPHTPKIEGFQRVDVVQDFLFTRVLLERIGACEGRKNAYGQDGNTYEPTGPRSGCTKYRLTSKRMKRTGTNKFKRSQID